ncbi:hypothetical protein AALP_AA7G103700, partial [Arabis alpina]
MTRRNLVLYYFETSPATTCLDLVFDFVSQLDENVVATQSLRRYLKILL